ncbi:hypothetical protein VE01_05151 [Pseudogymnoascus verrucosus]|uniref:Uncharacterized protein n=1 Tax=Pseudogymnoascus verrucosus TaxID=342668 RepID=A0A1B8GHV3_9PEZI|nr:uncharacterized protein VE01_05151 [Pseudogymnoascus verrucosus]OBT95420.1 hypothetical protein VE01_05151 [Pseudogymnoascus verrucosus]
MGQYGLRAEDGRAIVAIMAVIGVVSIASVALRIVSRRMRDLSLGLDDYLIMLAMQDGSDRPDTKQASGFAAIHLNDGSKQKYGLQLGNLVVKKTFVDTGKTSVLGYLRSRLNFLTRVYEDGERGALREEEGRVD